MSPLLQTNPASPTWMPRLDYLLLFGGLFFDGAVLVIRKRYVQEYVGTAFQNDRGSYSFEDRPAGEVVFPGDEERENSVPMALIGPRLSQVRDRSSMLFALPRKPWIRRTMESLGKATGEEMLELGIIVPP